MTTLITFTNDDGTPVPSVSSVPVVNGHSIQLSVAEGEEALLHLSPDLLAILSPSPGGTLELNGGGAVELTFTSSNQGAYYILVARGGAPAPVRFPSAPSSNVFIRVVLETVEGMSSGGSFAANQGTTSSGN